MITIDFIRTFPEIKEKRGKYYLFRGIIAGFSAKDILAIISNCLEQDILKRRILLHKITTSVPGWLKVENNLLFDEIYSLQNSLSSYFKKESASMILMALFPYVSKKRQTRLAKHFLQSKYKNNRNRIYKYFYDNWSLRYQKVIEKAWHDFRDKESLSLVVSKMPKDFLLKNVYSICEYFNEDDLSYDFHLKILRNRFYARLYDDMLSTIQKMKDADPVSFIFIAKERGKKIDIDWAIRVYKKYSWSRFLAKWYSEMGIWEDILKKNPDFLSKAKLCLGQQKLKEQIS